MMNRGEKSITAARPAGDAQSVLNAGKNLITCRRRASCIFAVS